ncbi:unnamed protein product [Cladocopium goreaui]|uniref:WW domain-containing protein n=1 Tax=Cladocopium goreaui TaxID=2562237 RepID=A0A9P1G3L1_9DINO|nr:unnamed protein product [Cladocopium goreaui]
MHVFATRCRACYFLGRYCVECLHTEANVAHLYCPECGDSLCLNCFEKLHAKGHRATHEPNHFILCVMCKVMPAKLQCTYTRGKYCSDCYHRKHAKTLPKFLDLKPLKIDYKRSAKLEREEKARKEGKQLESPLTIIDPEAKETFSKPAPLETTLGEKWHAFYDLRGVKYYYNFETQESMRRPQDDLVIQEEPEDTAFAAQRKEILMKMALSKEPRLMPQWEEGKERERSKGAIRSKGVGHEMSSEVRIAWVVGRPRRHDLLLPYCFRPVSDPFKQEFMHGAGPYDVDVGDTTEDDIWSSEDWSLFVDGFDAVCSVIRGDRRASFTESTSKMWPNAQGRSSHVLVLYRDLQLRRLRTTPAGDRLLKVHFPVPGELDESRKTHDPFDPFRQTSGHQTQPHRLSVHSATPQDLETLQDALQQPSDGLNPELHVLLLSETAEPMENLMGCASYEYLGIFGQRVCYICVAEPFRRRGVSKLLMSTLQKQMEERAAKPLASWQKDH